MFSVLYEQASLEQLNSKVLTDYYAAVLILDRKVHIKSIHRLKRGKLVFLTVSFIEMPIGIEFLISEESPYYSHNPVKSYGQEMLILKVMSENVAKVHQW